jgi:DNA polymerase III epsilon subunit-like protein
VTIRRQLEPLKVAIDLSDRLLGHNFRHDWRGITALFRDLGMSEPVKKPVIDTMRCIPAGIPRSLDALCDRFELGEKPHLSATDWTRALRRKEPDAIELVKNRNREDVILTERLYHKEREIGWLTNRTRTL